MDEQELPDLIDIFDAHLDNFVDEDEIVVFHDAGSEDNHIDVYWIKPEPEYRPYSILITCGMSRYPMNTPQGYTRFLEVAMLLPPDWDLTDIRKKPKTISWPIFHLQNIGKMPHAEDTWVGFGHTIECNESYGDFFPGTGFNSSIILPSITLPETFTEILNGNDLTTVYISLPLFPEELSYKLQNDSNALIEKFNIFNTPEVLNLSRSNTCK